MNQQLALAIKLQEDATLENFCWTGNEILYSSLLTSLTAKNPEDLSRFYYLWSATSTGKSHILQACCAYASRLGYPSAYLPLTQLKAYGPEILEGMEHVNLVAIDDIDNIAANDSWEEALFHFYNKIRDNHHTLFMVTAKTSPLALGLKLADLVSRLSWGMVHHLKPLDETAKLNVLMTRASQHGFELSAAVGQFLIKRCSRDLQELMNILERLDQASLAAQRKLTIPFVKQILAL